MNHKLKVIREGVFSLLALILISIPGILNAQNEVDAVLYNGKIITGPFTSEYSTLVIKGGKVEALYNDDSWRKTYKPVTTIDLKGKVVLPGFIDAHCHFLGLGKTMDEVSLYGVQNMTELAQRVAAYIKLHPERKWIGGRGWDQNNFPGKQFPNKRILDSMFGDKYIVLSRVDGHAVLANSNALKYCGVEIGREVEGGKILIENNQLSGVLIDNAVNLIENAMPKPSKKQKIEWLKTAQTECLKYGLTQVADAGLPIEDILLIDSLCSKKVLKMRFYLMGTPEQRTFDYIDKQGIIINNQVRFHSIKIYADGALGSRGALLKKPYCDDVHNHGLQLTSLSKLDSILEYTYRKGLQANTHCIGDSATSLVLKAYARTLKVTPNERRWRIEHAQIVDPIDWKYFKAYSIIPSVQPTHATSDMYWAESRLCKERMEGAYNYRSLLENADFLPLGTDFPVEYVSPFYTIRAARFRQDATGFPTDGFKKNEALTSEQTFAGMSIWAAMANVWEEQTGTLEVGKMADFIVLEKNPYTASLQELNTMKVLMTFISGVPAK